MFGSDNLDLTENIIIDIASMFLKIINSNYLEIYNTEISTIGKTNIFNTIEKYISNYISEKMLDIVYYNTIKNQGI